MDRDYKVHAACADVSVLESPVTTSVSPFGPEVTFDSHPVSTPTSVTLCGSVRS